MHLDVNRHIRPDRFTHGRDDRNGLLAIGGSQLRARGAERIDFEAAIASRDDLAGKPRDRACLTFRSTTALPAAHDRTRSSPRKSDWSPKKPMNRKDGWSSSRRRSWSTAGT
ncbi:MAG TPA: hypothetical protein VFI56_07545 [Vicinamibacterales bacterium]|nr:hypothetical protein [Vicinamibacterales bacterium]